MTKNNVFKIDLEQVYYEFDLGVATVKFSRSDENIKKMMADFKNLRNEITKYENLEEEEITEEKFDEVVTLVRKAWNETFEDETFDEVYKAAPSIQVIINAYSEIIYKINELNKVDKYKNKSDRAKEYVKNKRK